MDAQARWRLDHDGIHDVAVELRGDTTVGEVTDALLAYVGDRAGPIPPGQPSPTLEAGRVVDPHRRALDAAPRSGATVRIRSETHLADGGRDGAPVSLRTSGGERRLPYGRSAVADGVVIDVGGQVVVHDAGVGVVRIDGETVRGSAGVGHGALLSTDDWAATVGIHARLNPPPPGGPTVDMPVARGEWEDHEPDPVSLPAVPGRQRVPAFPWLTAMVPLLMAASVWVATRSLMMVGFMAFSFVYVLASGVEGRREARAADRLVVTEFREDLDMAAEDLEKRRSDQDHRDEMRHPSVGEAIDWTRLLSHRLWERSGRHPRPSEVRLGRAASPPDDRAVGDRRGRPELRGDLEAVLAHNDPSDRPSTIDLATTGGVAIVGDDRLTVPLAAALVAQLAVLTPPGRIGFELRADPERWRWAGWLPHLHTRAGLEITVLHRDECTEPAPRDRPTIWISPDTIRLPEHIHALVHFDDEGRATLQVQHGPAVEFRPETIPTSELESAARRLAGLRSADRDGASGPPEAVDLSDIGVGFTAEAVLAQWQRRLPGLPVPLGRAAGGVLTLDLAADGPHALVAGTTGAGKSELLRTLLAGLAALHRPDRLNLLLVDYKGGSAFGPLADLPHCVGLVTDLGPSEVDRTLTALRAELHRRERILDDHGEGDVRELAPAVRPPSLVLAIDEFATLVSEVPDFLDGVLDVAQRGRSLGIHMVLATQRPSGVVSQAVRANTSLRVALRLPDAEDSSDVVDSPAAAALPRDLPGRAVFRFGHDTLVTAQVAHTGAPARPPQGVRIHPLGDTAHPDRSLDRGPTQLEALVEAVGKASAEMGLVAPPPPLPPPLPERLELTGLGGPASPTGPGDARRAPPVAIGLVDLPHLQRREPLVVDTAERGGVLVVGGPRSGRSSTLVTIAVAMDRHPRTAVHAIDASGGLGALAGVASVRSVIEAGEHEAVHRLLVGLLERPPDHPVLVLVDDIARFEEQQAAINGGLAFDLLLRLAEVGRRSAVAVAVSAGRRGEVPPALMHALGVRIALRSVDTDQAAMLDAPPELADRLLPPGRAWVHGSWAQVALHDPGGEVRPLPRPPVLPTRVPVPDQETGSGRDDIWDLAVGTRGDDLRVAHIDLSRGGAVVAGRRGTGRSTVLAAMAEAARRRGVEVAAAGTAAEVLGQVADASRRGDSAPRLAVVDDLDDAIDDSEVDDLLCEVVYLARTEPVRVIVAGDPQRLLRCFSEGVAGLRAACTGVLLGGDSHQFGDLLHTEVRARQDIPPAAGRGWLLSAGQATVAQLAHPDA